ncbi:MAG: hypothetical protein ACOCXO_02690 [Bacteroidota bacterium]
MKYLLIIISLLVFAMSCGQKQENNNTTDTQSTHEALQLDTICDGQLYELECIKRVESHILKEHSNLASRENKTLHLSIENGEDLRFTSDDTPSPEKYISYRLTDYFPSLNAYLVHLSFYEGSTNKLINRKSGNMIETDGEILVSPDNSRFLAYNQNLTTTYTFNGFEVYSAEDDDYKQEHKEGLNWGPSDPTWLSNKKIEFVKISPMNFEPDGKAVYSLVDGEWVAE